MVHIQIAGICWCSHRDTEVFVNMAKRFRIEALCNHAKAADAVAMVHLLQDFQLDGVIVDGMCEWHPDHPDLAPLRKAVAKIKVIR